VGLDKGRRSQKMTVCRRRIAPLSLDAADHIKKVKTNSDEQQAILAQRFYVDGGIFENLL